MLCNTWIRDQYPSYSGDPKLVELIVDALERSSVERFGHTSNDCEHLKKSSQQVIYPFRRLGQLKRVLSINVIMPIGVKVLSESYQ